MKALVVQAFGEAGAFDCFLTKALTFPSYPPLNQSCVYKLLCAIRSLLAELTAIRDGQLPLASTLSTAGKL